MRLASNSYYSSRSGRLLPNTRSRLTDKWTITPIAQYFGNYAADRITTRFHGDSFDGLGDAWKVGITVDYQIVDNLYAKATVDYTDPDDADEVTKGLLPPAARVLIRNPGAPDQPGAPHSIAFSDPIDLRSVTGTGPVSLPDRPCFLPRYGCLPARQPSVPSADPIRHPPYQPPIDRGCVAAPNVWAQLLG